MEDFQTVRAFMEAGTPPPTVQEDRDYWVADSPEAVAHLFEELHKQNHVVVDLETTGFNYLKDKVLCVGFSWQEKQGVVLPLLGRATVEHPLGAPFWSDRMYEHILERLRAFCRSDVQSL